ncbi:MULTISPECIES: flagellar export chaperone FliS [Stenotrophomonas]|jgi:flagellar protein FliS|uniref:Flagellar secretion chaperone FliS n=1 Tax=Stenotrophomonas acidaminiphila TaxID=128780 RepID=A0A0R0DZ27_9GAMM|nr:MULTISPECIES: flagellar export chaperone FliS [Stenotrophomonas]OZB51424.1 MAG: flagellar export chaperone FliS [Stenotrophomonas sp. 14-69-23]ALJ28329.1 flagellar protein FliS [Stenotrophomonas acidaminiphila]KRG82942.1 flagellar biosynthesis protein FliS [Stenotrophomonas acidaminiphila]MCA7022318.1 flagellar export chaperone FliS [Stenotrophomonas acidaminiphila]MCE4074404.1 flagellar export chaperone FliS [Stenotrophomonas acidaminiphila]
MYGSSRNYAEQYRKVGVSTKVVDADPHKLVALLFEGAGERIRRAEAFLAQGDQAMKGKAIGEACAIIGHLNGSLDHEAGGEIAGNLSALYDYVIQRLTEANLNNDVLALQESLSLMGEIESAWNAIPSDQRQRPAVTGA